MFSKKLTAFALAGILGCSPFFSAVTGAGVITSYADAKAWSKSDGSYRMIDGTSINGVYARGIDVSHWQQDINWQQVANDDISFVMLGTRYKGEVDPRFHANAQAAHNAGIKLGAYIYSYATNTEMAAAEADFVLNLVKDYPISYPIAFDVEDSSTLGTLSQGELTAVINTFCEKIRAAGYYPIVYANDYWLANKIDLSKLPYEVWVARYEVKHTFENPVMWQATSTGSVNGIQGNVDIDFQYKDFSGNIPANQWRTIGDKTYYYQNYLMQKNSWIDDGSGWYFMDSEGQTSKGWLNQNGSHYYLAEDSGKMTTGWAQLDSKWYYFNGSGVMSTGWTEADGSRYFMDSNGVMQTGWLNQDGKHYYLKNSGAMSTGWQDIDGKWYYLNDSGERTSGWQNLGGTYYFMNQDGVMQTGWINENNVSYYLKSSGAMSTGWQDIGGSWYYFNGSGAMQTGMLDLNGVKYYLGNDGKMFVNTVFEAEGVTYQADGSGVCTPVVSEAENSEAGGTEAGTADGTGSGAANGNGSGSNTNVSDNPDDYTGPGMEIS